MNQLITKIITNISVIEMESINLMNVFSASFNAVSPYNSNTPKFTYEPLNANFRMEKQIDIPFNFIA